MTFFTFSLIHASSLSTFLLNSCRFLAPPSALVWLAAVCFRVCHWSLSWLSCFFTRSEVGFSLQINCSPIFLNREEHKDIVHWRCTAGRATRLTQHGGWVHLTPPVCQSHCLCASCLHKCWKIAINFLDKPLNLPFLGCLSVRWG